MSATGRPEPESLPPGEPARTGKGAEGSGPAKVLVVDDTPHNVKLLADLLGAKGYAVATATNGEEALAKVAAERPDLVLLDIIMPGLSGYDVCRRLRADADTALLPIVLVTRSTRSRSGSRASRPAPTTSWGSRSTSPSSSPACVRCCA